MVVSSSWDDGPFGMKFVTPPKVGAVIVDRIKDVPDPEYCTHGRTRCMRCHEWCWLGDQTFKIVSNAEAAPLCLACARSLPEIANYPVTYSAPDSLKGHP